MKLVILAAGVGSRMGIPEKHKCTLDVKGYPFVCRMIRNVLEGVNKTISEIIVVTGHLSSQVEIIIRTGIGYDIDRIGAKLTFIKNEIYLDSGSGYSLALIGSHIHPDDEEEGLLVVEADCMLPPQVYGDLVADGSVTKGLIGPRVDRHKSVIACTHKGIDSLSYYGYDRSHKNVFETLPDNMLILGESLQAWYISPTHQTQYLFECIEIKDQMDTGKVDPAYYSNLEPINRLLPKIGGIGYSQYDGVFINLNTTADIDLANSLPWT